MTNPSVPMRNGNKQQRERFLKYVLGIQSKSGHTERMTEFIVACGKEMGAKVKRDGQNIYLTKGKAKVYPTFVAHTDTVHAIIDDFRVLQSDNLLLGFNQRTGEQVGVGGDDKVGVFLALQMLIELEYGKAAFFYDEEIGCVGARRADLSFFKDSAFLIQGDRRGVSDVVIRASGDDLCSPEFQLAISPQVVKYRRELCRTGLMTDVQELTSMRVGVSALNLSCGYFNPHSQWETVSIPIVMDTLRFIREVTKAHGNVRWEHEIPTRSYGRWNKGRFQQAPLSARDDRYDASDYYWDDDPDFDATWNAALEQAKRGRLTNTERDDRKFSTHPHNRWRLQISNDRKGYEKQVATITESIATQIKAGKKWLAPSLEYTGRSYLDWQVESTFCPDCGECALTLDLADESPLRTDMLTYCWACGEAKWKAQDTITFWWDNEVYTSNGAKEFIELELLSYGKEVEEEAKPVRSLVVVKKEAAS